jgi:DNA primase
MTGKAGNVQGGNTLPKRHHPDAQRSSCPRASGASHPRSNIIAQIKERLTPARIEALCRDWLPEGKRQGAWWVCRTPWRDDRTPSLGVSLTTGHWHDFGKGDSGDMLDLAMRLFGDSLPEVIKGFAEMLGIQR